MYRTERNYENLNKGIFPGAGRFDIPILRPELTTAENWISFNYAKGCEEPSEHGVHFFVDDYQFNRIWAHPDNYLGMMARFDTVCTPDFSTYTDFPRIIQIYNHYRNPDQSDVTVPTDEGDNDNADQGGGNPATPFGSGPGEE